jgi:hypothetical protein
MPAVRDMAMTPTLRGQFPTRPAEVTPPSRRERLVLALVCLTLVLPVWLAGAWVQWAQLVTVGLAVLTLAALFVPMFDYRGWPPSPGAQEAWERLRTFPIFWMGLAVMLYGLIAALNPSRVQMVNDQRFWLENVPHWSFLPQSLITPFSPMNAWHALMIILPGWLVVCAAWAGLETEQSWRWLLGAVALNGTVLAIVGMAQAVSGSHRLFWLFELQPGNTDSAYFGSFAWAGHAAAWLTLAFGATAAITDHHLRRRDPQEPQRRWGWPALRTWFWLGSLMVIFLALGLFVEPDFWWLGAGLICLLAVWLWLARVWREGQKRRAVMYALPALVFMGFILLAMGGAVWLWRQGDKANLLEVNPRDPGLPLRYAFAKTSAVMIKDQPLFGWGPGSFRYISPYYLALNPVFGDPENRGEALYGLHYALNDWVQYLAEWGILGLSLFIATIAWWARQAWRMRKVLPGESWITLGAVVVLLVEAGVDCPFYNPAVLIAAAVLPAVALKLGEMSARPRPALSKVVVACP